MKKLILTVALFASGYGLVFLIFLLMPGEGDPHPVIVAPGMPFKEISRTLETKGIIKNRFHFRTLATLLRATRRSEAGEYLFPEPLRPLTVLFMLIHGDVIKYSVTIPEGTTLRGIASTLSAAGLVDEPVFLARASDPAFINSLGLEGRTLEGYLFPETYKLKKGMAAEEVLSLFVRMYRKYVTPDLEERARQIGMTPYQVLILASIIEKEARQPEERSLISAVFHNRLKRGMPLQADPTVIYGVGGIEGRIRKSQLKKDTPYNTYLHRGLPPGPIGSPGLSSILAALSPSPVTYLYFVSKNNGTHVFTSSLREHNRYVYKFQRNHRIKKDRHHESQSHP